MREQEKDQKPPLVFIVGDEIRVRITFEHYENVDEVRAIFERKVGLQSNTITLIGTSDDLQTEVVERREDAPVRKQSTAVLVTLVDVDYRPGPYYFGRLVVRTVSGSSITHRATEKQKSEHGVAFKIAEESPGVFDVEVSLEEPDEDPDEEP